jgi:hypothetical protein
MKTAIYILGPLIFLASTCLPQNKIDRIRQEKSAAKLIQVSEGKQIAKAIQIIIQYYGKSFKYYKELLSGNYAIEGATQNRASKHILKIFTNGKNPVKFEAIRLYRKTLRQGYAELLFDRNDVEKFVNFGELRRMNNRNSPRQSITIVDKEKILFDQMILKDDDIPSEYWRILNRTVTENVEDQNGDPFAMFRLLQSGVLIPLCTDGSESKFLGIDNQYHSIIYFDANASAFGGDDVTLNEVYGYRGLGYGQFLNPTGITLGRPNYYPGWPIYIADQYNFRIVRVIYMTPEYPELGYIDENSFYTFNGFNFPYDVVFVGGRWLTGSPGTVNADKVWISEAHPTIPSLTCFGVDGEPFLQRFCGYYDNSTGTFYKFFPGTTSRLSVPFWTPSCPSISFIDNVRNCIVTCRLSGGEAVSSAQNGDGLYIGADDILLFPENERINSIKFQITSPLSYPYVWVTSDNKIHCLKLNLELIKMQYLASTNKPFNTDVPFHSLMNTVSTTPSEESYSDLFTIEAWNYDYGIRRYLPFADMYSDELSNYCADGSDQMKYHAVFTNDCWVELRAERKTTDGWEAVKIKKVNGETFDDYTATVYQLAGDNELWGDGMLIQLELPEADYLLSGRVRLHVKLMPDNVNPYVAEKNYVTKEYEVDVTRNCRPRPVGCPYLYVQDTVNSYQVDNNLLLRSEFQEYAGSDIKDVYKLRVQPFINNDLITLAIVENEADSSDFDQIKLHAIDHQGNTVLGITETNDYVLYNPANVISTDNALLNSQDITSEIQYNGNEYVKPHIGDTIFAHYPNPQNKGRRTKVSVETNDLRFGRYQARINSQRQDSKGAVVVDIDSVALISFIGNLDTINPVAQKTWAGTIDALSYASSQTNTKFARREKLSEVIIPLFGASDYLEQATINATSDSKVRYIATVSVTYSSSLANYEIALQSALLITRTSQTDISGQISTIDQQYARMDSSGFIQLQFNTSGLPALPDGWVRDYVIEADGKYFPVNGVHPMNPINNVPLTNRLYHNYPNPFNPKTRIKYEISRNISVKITIYNILGQEIKVLVNEFKNAGRYEVEFDGMNYASGVYFYRIEAGDFIDAKKMVLVK